jgi:hypothetical protein
MGRLEKVKDKFLNPGSVVNYGELKYLLGQLNYSEKRLGKSSGSRVAYVNTRTKHIIRIHRPNPGNELRMYVKNYVVSELKKERLI